MKVYKLILIVPNIRDSLGENLEVLKASTTQSISEHTATWDKKQQDQLRAEKEKLLKDIEALCEKLITQEREKEKEKEREREREKEREEKKDKLVSPREEVEGMIGKRLREEREQWEKERAKKDAAARERLEEFWKKELSHQQEEFFNKRKEWETQQQKERQQWENEQKKKYAGLEQRLHEWQGKLEAIKATEATKPKHEGILLPSLFSPPPLPLILSLPIAICG